MAKLLDFEYLVIWINSGTMNDGHLIVGFQLMYSKIRAPEDIPKTRNNLIIFNTDTQLHNPGLPLALIPLFSSN
jgi:hypothetical protein